MNPQSRIWSFTYRGLFWSLLYCFQRCLVCQGMACLFHIFFLGYCLIKFQVFLTHGRTRFYFKGYYYFRKKQNCGNTWWQQWVARKEWWTGYSSFKEQNVWANSIQLSSFPRAHLYISAFFMRIFASPGVTMRFFWGHFIPQWVCIQMLPTSSSDHRQEPDDPQKHRSNLTPLSCCCLACSSSLGCSNCSYNI